MYKIILSGNIRVGKTSLRKRYMGEGFRESYSATLGADFSVKSTKLGKIVVYDLAGDPASKLVRQQYYLGAHGFILVFSVSDRESFENLDYWVSEIKANVSGNHPVFILGNKVDLYDEIEDPVDDQEAYQYSKKLADELDTSVSFLSTSALTGYNVEVAFNKLLTEISNTEE